MNISVKFKTVYERLDELCRKKLNQSSCGVEEYAKYLLRFCGRESCEVAKRLEKYSAALKESAASRNLNVTKRDIAWLLALYKRLSSKKDPLTKYLNCLR